MALPMRNMLLRIYRRHRSLLHNKSLVLQRRCNTLNDCGVRVRFAPSPTGQMHLGGLRTALYNYLFAKSENGVFILRIEDTDQSRKVDGATKNILSVLEWSGLTPDEGPGIGGEYGPYTQSERKDLYTDYANRMLESGHAYRCFCSKKRLELLKKEQLSRGEATGYDNKCRSLTEDEIKKNMDAKTKFVIRFKYEPISEPTPDLIHKQINEKIVGQVPEGDLIIMKNDSYPTYHFANVVDDHLMKISHVLRGEEWSISTSKHIQMYKAFGWSPPQYGHLPLILNKDGKKLSKREEGINVAYFMERHTDPNALLNYLTSSNSGFKEPTNGKTLQQMVNSFSLPMIKTNSTRLQPEQLRERNLDHLIRNFKEDRTKTVDKVYAFLEETFRDTKFTKTYVEEILEWALNERRICELEDLTTGGLKFIWFPPLSKKLGKSLAKFPMASEILPTVIADLEQNNVKSEMQMKELISSCCQRLKCSKMDVFKILRMSLSSEKSGPPVYEMMEMLGKHEFLHRLKQANIAVTQNVQESEVST